MFVGREREFESLRLLLDKRTPSLVYEGRTRCGRTKCFSRELAPVVRGNGYFDAIISAADLLGL